MPLLAGAVVLEDRRAGGDGLRPTAPSAGNARGTATRVTCRSTSARAGDAELVEEQAELGAQVRADLRGVLLGIVHRRRLNGPIAFLRVL